MKQGQRIIRGSVVSAALWVCLAGNTGVAEAQWRTHHSAGDDEARAREGGVERPEVRTARQRYRRARGAFRGTLTLSVLSGFSLTMTSIAAFDQCFVLFGDEPSHCDRLDRIVWAVAGLTVVSVVSMLVSLGFKIRRERQLRRARWPPRAAVVFTGDRLTVRW